MEKPHYPFLWLIAPIILAFIFGQQLIHEYLTYGFNLKLLGVIFLCLLILALPSTFALIIFKRYQQDLHLYKVCTQASTGTVKEIGLSQHNTGHSNPAFVTVEFRGATKDFVRIPDEWRFRFTKNDSINVLYNPLKPSEFVLAETQHYH